MKPFWIVAVCAMLAGCDYTVPLVTAPALDIDRAIMGVWERTTAQKQTERLLVLPLDQRQYLVAYPAGETHTMYAKGCLAKCADKTFVQLEWFGTADGKEPEDTRVYQLATYTLKGDELTVRMVSTDVVSKDITTSADLAKSIEKNKAKPELLGEPMVFKKAAAL